MSLSGISTGDLFSSQYAQSAQTSLQKFQREFQQLGQDLKSGNRSQAQSDFTTLESDNPQVAASSQSTSNPVAAAFTQLSQDLQSGNISAAQKDYATIQQDFQQQSAGATAGQHHHHHHRHSAGSQDSTSSQNPMEQLFSQLGQALQADNLTSAQSAYASLQQDFTELGSPTATGSSSSSSSSSTSGAVNLSV
jgi:outer membrane protein assembly factor BamD (BamD/ComL family)